MPTAKRITADALDNEPPLKRYRLDDDQVTEGVDRLVAHYKLDAAQKARLDRVAKITRYTPTVREVEWVVRAAELPSDGTNLDMWMFAYMEYFDWFLRSQGQDHRLWTGALRRYDKRVAYLWIGFKGASKSGPKGTLYFDGPQGPNKPKNVFRPPFWARCWITWHEPLETLFALGENFSQDITDDSANKIAAGIQNEILKAVMKVLARFPGLISELEDEDQSIIYQLHARYSATPFKDREAFDPSGPLAKLFELLCTKSQESTPKKTPFKTLEQEYEEASVSVKAAKTLIPRGRGAM
ncbi:hypothetical protein M436DRAFT_82674 [Aureobasidium namibiae CBS 147.97]|uniref:Uncharacterized protein n=1 Tax=Aureobasidium namibiae CBS 147.97 TaxID=1043004 RepID=A0A074XD74_9PEZI